MPIKLLHECEGHIISIETVAGEIFRGQLKNAEDTMNVHMEQVQYVSRKGQKRRLNNVYIRGSKIVFIRVPDMLSNAPMFTRFDPRNKDVQGLGMGLHSRAFQHGRQGEAFGLLV